MKPITQLDSATARLLRGILFDLDDTLLDRSELTEVAYGALHRLSEAGLTLLAVTGRPAGYGEVLVPAWPIAGLIAENGSVAVLKVDGRTQLFDEVNVTQRRARREQLQTLVTHMKCEFPLLMPATDVHLRRCDYTFDIGEYQHVDHEVITAVIAFARARGASTVRSSVHLHVGFDGSDKASGTLRVLSRHFGYDVTHARAQFAFIGDSENDEAAFAAFNTTIAVANLRGRPTVNPRYATQAPRGRGFAEFVQRLLALRS